MNYQQLGMAVSVQAFNPSTGQPYQLSDLSFDAGTVGTGDPAFISLLMHGAPSWYIGSDLDVLHLVDLQVPSLDGTFFPALQWHVDLYNPTASVLTFLQHEFSEVVPGIGLSGPGLRITCTVSGGCH